MVQSAVDKFLNGNSAATSSGSAVDAELARAKDQAKAKADLAKRLADAGQKANNVVKDSRNADLSKSNTPKTGLDKVKAALADATKAKEAKEQPKEDKITKDKKANNKAEEKLAAKKHEKKTADKKSPEGQKGKVDGFGDYESVKNELEQLLGEVIAEEGEGVGAEGDVSTEDFLFGNKKATKKPIKKGDGKTANELRGRLKDLQASQGGKAKDITKNLQDMLSGNKTGSPKPAPQSPEVKGNKEYTFKNGSLYQKGPDGKWIPADKKTTTLKEAPKALSSKTKTAAKQKKALLSGQNKTANLGRLEKALADSSAQKVAEGKVPEAQLDAAKKAVQSGIAKDIREENDERRKKLDEKSLSGMFKNKFEGILGLLNDEGIGEDSGEPLPASVESSLQTFAAFTAKGLGAMIKGASYMIDPEHGPFQDISGTAFSDPEAVAKRNKILGAKPGSLEVKSDQALNLTAGGNRKISKHTGKLEPEKIQSDLDIEQPEGYQAGKYAQYREGSDQAV